MDRTWIRMLSVKVNIVFLATCSAMITVTFAQHDQPLDHSWNPLTNQQHIDNAGQHQVDQRLNQDQKWLNPELQERLDASARNPQDPSLLAQQGWGNHFDARRNHFSGGNVYLNRDFKQYLGPNGVPVGEYAYDYVNLDHQDPVPEPFNEDNEQWEPSSIQAMITVTFAQHDQPLDHSWNPLTNQQRIDNVGQHQVDQILNQDQKWLNPELQERLDASARNPQYPSLLAQQGWGNHFDARRNHFSGGNVYLNRDFKQYLGPNGVPVGEFAYDYVNLDHQDPVPEPFNEDNEQWEPSSIQELDGKGRSEVISHDDADPSDKVTSSLQ
ncbi:unnamed protein product [Notodromas monacha]|uniref:Uncharacterized protein n=1 Tax=Notodromas monacha TaxID=399045 RepID=A0A7R9GG30_9CRUS|nr:unnamed protein product [Notodromas monacha]CAG0921273.1 unnamed protein product [Notodromas monacha]